MKKNIGMLLIGISIILPTVSQAGLVCEERKFVGPPEVFSIDPQAKTVKVSWTNSYFPTVDQALKFANPAYQDEVISAQFTFLAGDCQGADLNPLLYHCSASQNGVLLLSFKSKKTLKVTAQIAVDTTLTRRTSVVLGQVRENEVLVPTMLFSLFLPNSKPLYAAEQHELGFQACK